MPTLRRIEFRDQPWVRGPIKLLAQPSGVADAVDSHAVDAPRPRHHGHHLGRPGFLDPSTDSAFLNDKVVAPGYHLCRA